MGKWTLLSNHGHVLVCLTRDSEARLRDVAADVGITERAVQKIVRDLQEGGMVSVSKNGRRNSYRIHKKKTLRHDLEVHCTLRDFIGLVREKPERKGKAEPVVKAAKAMGIEAIIPPEKPRPKKVASSKAEAVGSKQPDSIERQQGSLF
jgi:predicted transcriptional regulator